MSQDPYKWVINVKIISNLSRVQADQSNTDGPPPRPGSQMEQGMSSSPSASAFQNKKTTSAPTSPLKEKPKSSFFGKVRHHKSKKTELTQTQRNSWRNVLSFSCTHLPLWRGK